MSRSQWRCKQKPQSCHPLVETLEDRTLLATFTVSSLADSGPGTLHQAILDANGNPGTDTITFNVAGTIRPQSELPALNQIFLDGNSAPGFAGNPVVELDGSLAGNANGLVLNNFGITVRGLAVNRFGGLAGILVTASDSVLTNNFIGTDLTGTQARPNAGAGVVITNTQPSLPGKSGGYDITVGGTTAQLRNLISGNGRRGRGHHRRCVQHAPG